MMIGLYPTSRLMSNDKISDLVEDLKEPRTTVIDRPFVEKMIVRFNQWTPAGIIERIKEARAHPNWKKYNDKQRYVTGWLRRDYERIFGSRSNGKSGSNLRPNPQEQAMADRTRDQRLADRRNVSDLPRDGMGEPEA